MPVIKRLRNCTIKLFADEHPPPHFHVEFSDGTRCSIKIESLDILAGEVYPASRLAEALEWARANRPLLRAKWKELAENETTGD